jgi:hypothetical protein
MACSVLGCGKLTISDGRTFLVNWCARVIQVSPPRGPPGAAYDPSTGSLTTYNIEVAEAHTYFVGASGVWVHNAGNECERILNVFLRQLRRVSPAADNPMEAFIRTRSALPELSERADASLVSGVLDEITRMNDDGVLVGRWRELGFDPDVNDFRATEVLAGYRLEQQRPGIVLQRGGPGIDFVSGVGPDQTRWHLKGPVPDAFDHRERIAGVHQSIREFFESTTMGARDILVVDVAGMHPLDKLAVQYHLQQVGTVDRYVLIP